MWDVNVDNHIIFTELNGCSLITGNSNNSCKTPIENMTIKYGGKRIFITHNPEHVGFITGCDLAFTGHVHNAWEIKRVKRQFDFIDCINIGVDVWGFRPVSIAEILSRYAKWKRNISI